MGRRFLCAGSFIAVLLGSCGLSDSSTKELNYSEARSLLVKHVDAALMAGLKARPLPTGEFESDTRCFNEDGSYSATRFYATYGYFFPIDVLGDEPDRLLTEAARVWRQSGFRVSRDERTPGVAITFASGKGFHLSAFVNHNSGEAHVGGSGLCAVPPKPPA